MPHISLDEPLQQGLQALPEALDRRTPGASARTPPRPSGGLAGVVEQPGERAPELLAVVRIDQQAGLAVDHDLLGGAAAGGEHRLAGPHRLQVDEPEPLPRLGITKAAQRR